MKKVYFISGLGADKRVFSLLDLSFCQPVYIDWITPIEKESLKDYALRLRKQIKEENPTVVGISLGGMLTTEMAKADKNLNAIIIASNKTSLEFPSYFRIIKYFPIYKFGPQSLLKRIMYHNVWILGGKREKQTQLLKQIIKDSDSVFVRWAINAILNWKNTVIPPNLVHIHGTADKLLPNRFVKANYLIKGGTHVITIDKPEEISNLLQKLIK